MDYESRLKTFSQMGGWPLSAATHPLCTKEKMAAAGFFYARDSKACLRENIPLEMASI